MRQRAGLFGRIFFFKATFHVSQNLILPVRNLGVGGGGRGPGCFWSHSQRMWFPQTSTSQMSVSTQIPQGACLKANSDSVDLQSLRLSRSNKLQGDADAAGLGITLRGAQPQSPLSLTSPYIWQRKQQ